ncbi:MAG: hypothetical protein ACR2OM_01390, partial [Aestuariivirgaceae bacterium]
MVGQFLQQLLFAARFERGENCATRNNIGKLHCAIFLPARIHHPVIMTGPAESRQYKFRAFPPFRAAGGRIIHIHHHSTEKGSPFTAGLPGAEVQ